MLLDILAPRVYTGTASAAIATMTRPHPRPAARRFGAACAASLLVACAAAHPVQPMGLLAAPGDEVAFMNQPPSSALLPRPLRRYRDAHLSVDECYAVPQEAARLERDVMRMLLRVM